MDKNAIQELASLGLVVDEKKLVNKKNIIVATHDEAFHPDDMLCVGLLEKIYGEDHVTVIRSREAEEYNKGDYILDVGKKDEIRRDLLGRVTRVQIDHHQEAGAEGFYESGIKKSAIGKFVDYMFKPGPERDMIHKKSLDLLEFSDNRQIAKDIKDPVVREAISADNPYKTVLLGNINGADSLEDKEEKVAQSSKLALAIFIRDAAVIMGREDIADRENAVIRDITAEKEAIEAEITKPILDKVISCYLDSDTPGLCDTLSTGIVDDFTAYNKVIPKLNAMIETDMSALKETVGKEAAEELGRLGPIYSITGEDLWGTKYAVRMIQDNLTHKDSDNYYPLKISEEDANLERKVAGCFAHDNCHLVTYRYEEGISRREAMERGQELAEKTVRSFQREKVEEYHKGRGDVPDFDQMIKACKQEADREQRKPEVRVNPYYEYGER